MTVAVAKLTEEGKLSWEDPLGKFFPGFPVAEAREKVRIRHLLTHTSGLQDFLRYCEQHAHTIRARRALLPAARSSRRLSPRYPGWRIALGEEGAMDSRIPK